MSINKVRGRKRHAEDPMMEIQSTSTSFWCSAQIEFTTTDVGFITVVGDLYRQCDTGYLSESMLLYYSTILLWARKAQLAKCNHFTAVADEVYNIAYYGESMTTQSVPKILSMYYSGIGNITDYDNNKYYWINVVWPKPEKYRGVSGYFGPVNDFTHTHYMNLLSPGVVAQRILEEIAYSENNKTSGENWDLPQELRPTVKCAGFPTENLLGYSKTTLLTERQLKTLKNAGVTVKNGERSFGEISNNTFCLNTSLFLAIRNIIHFQLKTKKSVFPNKQIGSLSQIPFIEDNISSTYKVEIRSPFNFPSQIADASGAFKYRINIETSENTILRRIIYDFENTISNVPQTWLANFNQYFDDGTPGLWKNGYLKAKGFSILHSIIATHRIENETDSDSD